MSRFCPHCDTLISSNPAGQDRDAAGDHHTPGGDNCIKLLKTRMRMATKALVSIGKNTCGLEPLAATFARGILAEIAETKKG